MQSHTLFRRFHLPTVLLVALVMSLQASSVATRPAVAAEETAQILPVNSTPNGLSYGEWSARHWQWLYSLPVDAHPLFDTADVSAGQSGPVWFLGGTFESVDQGDGALLGEATRDVTIPANKKLFFPLLDAECNNIEGTDDDEAALRDCANFFGDLIVPETLQLEIDGVAATNLEDFRVESPLFEFGPLPENNALGAEAGATSPSVSDGYFVMLPPFSVGEHTIHFSGLLDALDEFGITFELGITYNLDVVPPGRYAASAIPEPTSGLLAALGFVGVGAIRRRKH